LTTTKVLRSWTLFDFIIIKAGWKLLVYVFVMEYPRPPESDTKIVVKTVGVPKGSLATLDFDICDTTAKIRLPISVKTNCQCEASRRSKEAPAVIYPGP
jgi:hypothetical protein